MNQEQLGRAIRRIDVFDDSKALIFMLSDAATKHPDIAYICNEAALHIDGLWELINRFKDHHLDTEQY